MKHWVFVAGGLALASCKHDPSPPAPAPKPNTAAAAATSAAAVTSAVLAPSASPSAAAVKARPQDAAQRLLMEWNAALDHHSVEALTPLYAAKVDFYGQHHTAEQVLEAKRQAFAKQPDFKQRVGAASIHKERGGFRVTFKKLSGAALKNETVGVLVVMPLDGKWQITEESDEATDARFKPKADSCPDAAQNIVSSEPTVIADIERVSREFPDAHPGGLHYDFEEHGDRYSGSQGYFHDDRYEPRWWVDAGSGDITIRDAYTGELLPVTPQQRALVRKLCTGKLPDDDGGGTP